MGPYQTAADGTVIACPHAAPCCPACRAGDPALVDVSGTLMWLPDPADRAILAGASAETLTDGQLAGDDGYRPAPGQPAHPDSPTVG